MALVKFLDKDGNAESEYRGYPSAKEAIAHAKEAAERLKKGEGHQTAVSVVAVESGNELFRYDVPAKTDD